MTFSDSGGITDPKFIHVDDDHICFYARGNCNGLIASMKLRCVAQKIGKYLLHARRVKRKFQLTGCLKFKRAAGVAALASSIAH